MKPTLLSRQHGVALLTALIFLVILTLLGIGVYSTTTSEEKMARNFRDKEIALQAAEAALNEAKIWITASYNTGGTAPNPLPQELTRESCSTTTAGFICEPTSITIDYNSYDLFVSSATYAEVGTRSASITGLSAQPRYLIILEQQSDRCSPSKKHPHCFKILAQAQGRLNTTRVNLIEQFTH